MLLFKLFEWRKKHVKVFRKTLKFMDLSCFFSIFLQKKCMIHSFFTHMSETFGEDYIFRFGQRKGRSGIDRYSEQGKSVPEERKKAARGLVCVYMVSFPSRYPSVWRRKGHDKQEEDDWMDTELCSRNGENRRMRKDENWGILLKSKNKQLKKKEQFWMEKNEKKTVSEKNFKNKF